MGQVHAGGGCVSVAANKNRNVSCSPWDTWSGSTCLLQIRFLDDCSGLALAMDRQQQRMRAADLAQQSACSTGTGQECSDLATSAQSEASLYRKLEEKHRMCQENSASVNSIGTLAGWSYSRGLLFDPLQMDADYR